MENPASPHRLLFLGSRVGSAVLQAGIIAVIAQGASVEDFGVIMAALAMGVVAVAVFDLGIETAVVREASLHQDSPVIAAMLRVNRRISVGLFAFLSVLYASLGFGQGLGGTLLFSGTLAAGIALDRVAQVRSAFAVAVGNLRLAAVNLPSRRVTTLLAFVLLNPTVGSLAAYALSACAGGVVGLLASRLPLASQHSNRTVRGVGLRMLWPFYLNSVAAQLRNLDVPLIAVMAGSIAAAHYALPARLGAAVLVLPTAAAPLLLSAVHVLHRLSAKQVFLRLAIYAMSIGLILVPIAYFIEDILTTLGGDGFRESTEMGRIYLAGLWFLCLTAILVPFMQATGLERRVALVTVSCNVILPFMLGVGIFIEGGGVGAAIGFTVLQAILAVGLILIAIQRTLGAGVAR